MACRVLNKCNLRNKVKHSWNRTLDLEIKHPAPNMLYISTTSIKVYANVYAVSVTNSEKIPDNKANKQTHRQTDRHPRLNDTGTGRL